MQRYRRIERIWCPALREYVVFNRIGFQHLVRGGSVQRPKSEQKRRFKLIPYITDILTDPNASITEKEGTIKHQMKIRGEKIPVASPAHFWVFTNRRNGQTIKLVVRQFNGKEKHFLSIYAKKPSKNEGFLSMPAVDNETSTGTTAPQA